MSLFFRHVPTVEANFSVQKAAEALRENTVLVSQDIWDALSFSAESPRILSIRPKRCYPATNRSLSHCVNALTCWAVYDQTVHEIAIPSAWLVAYPTVFQPFQTSLDGSSKSVILSAVQNTTLTEVVLTAEDKEAYLAASLHGLEFENWFFESCVIIRDGEQVFVPPSILSTCGRSTTSSSLFVYTVSLALPYKQGIAQRGSTRFIVVLSDELKQGSNTDNSRATGENLEISESFLISTALSSSEPYPQANESEAVFSAKALQSPIDADMDQFTIYVCPSHLRPLGILNGDWVLALPIDSSSSRLLRVGALDGACIDSGVRSALLSPTLLHNLCARGRQQIVLRVSPYGTRSPNVPIAKSITLARVASPFSIYRRYESLFIGALREYFSSSRRLVKCGDIIPLRIDIDNSLDPHHSLSPDDVAGTFLQKCSDVLVYFVVRSLEDESVVRKHGQFIPVSHLGCFVDSNETRITQAGLEHIGVPNVYDYYQLRHTQAALPTLSGISSQVSRLSNAVSLDEARILGVRTTVFIAGLRGMGKFSIAAHIAQHLQLHLVEINCFHTLSETAAKTEASLREQVEKAICCSPSLVVLRHADALSHLANTSDDRGASILQNIQQCIDDANNVQEQQCILIGIAEQDKMPHGISFSNEIEMRALCEEDRLYLLLEQMDSQGVLLAPDVSVAVLSKQTAAFSPLDLENLIKKTCLSAIISSEIQQPVTQPVISIKQFDSTLHKSRTCFSQSIGAPSIPTVLWEDIGGLGLVKHDILDTVQLPLDHPELFQDGLKKRSGVLLYGPPGTGKTLLAKAVATSCSLNFFSIKGPELLNMYIGESEANVRKVFQRARDAKPCVIFFDELDSIAPKRGNQGDSGGVMDRIVSQLLAELDGMSIGGMDIFVIGATNRPDLLDPALLRPGRFDKMLYLGVCETHEAQLDILKALTRKFSLHPNFNLSSVVTHCPFNYTGADFYALCADALLHALSQKVAKLERERAELNALPEHQLHPISSQFFVSEMKSNADLQLEVKMDDFIIALKELIPSISNSELIYYASIQKNWHN